MIEVKEDWCKGCDLCIERCPVDALEESDTLNRRGIRPPKLKDENECNYCRLCELICPDLAITVIPDEDIKKPVKKTLLTLKEGRVEAAKQGIENGVAIRVLVNGAWGFSSIGSLNLADLKSAVSDACRMARAIGKRIKNPIKLAKTKPLIDKVGVVAKENPATITMEDKIKTTMSINRACLGYNKQIKSCTIDYLDLFGNCILRLSSAEVFDYSNN